MKYAKVRYFYNGDKYWLKLSLEEGKKMQRQIIKSITSSKKFGEKPIKIETEAGMRYINPRDIEIKERNDKDPKPKEPKSKQ